MPKGEIFPVEYELSDVVREKEALYSSLKEAPDLNDHGLYLSALVASLRCGLIDEKTYTSFSGMGIIEEIPFEIMAFNLRGKLLEELERDFAKMEAEEKTGKVVAGPNRAEDEIIAHVSEEVKMSCL